MMTILLLPQRSWKAVAEKRTSQVSITAGVACVIKPGKTSVQVIIGTKVQFVADAFSALCK